MGKQSRLGRAGLGLLLVVLGSTTWVDTAAAVPLKPIAPDRWVHTVCVGLLEQFTALDDVETELSETFVDLRSGEIDAKAAKSDLVTGYRDEAETAGTLSKEIKKSTPKIDNGRRVAKNLLANLEDMRAASNKAKGEVSDLRVIDDATFLAGVTEINAARLTELQEATDPLEQLGSVAELGAALDADASCAEAFFPARGVSTAATYYDAGDDFRVPGRLVDVFTVTGVKCDGFAGAWTLGNNAGEPTPGSGSFTVTLNEIGQGTFAMQVDVNAGGIPSTVTGSGPASYDSGARTIVLETTDLILRDLEFGIDTPVTFFGGTLRLEVGNFCTDGVPNP